VPPAPGSGHSTFVIRHSSFHQQHALRRGEGAAHLDTVEVQARGQIPPVEGDLVVPVEGLPENLKENMGAEWRLRKRNQEAPDEP